VTIKISEKNQTKRAAIIILLPTRKKEGQEATEAKIEVMKILKKDKVLRD
jgi:hypothetical protein